MKIENIKEISILAKQKGFVPKIFSTIWTFDSYNGIKDYPMVTNMCDYLLLCEIQFWLREIHKIHSEALTSNISESIEKSIIIYNSSIITQDLDIILDTSLFFHNALSISILYGLNLLPNIDLINDKNK